LRLIDLVAGEKTQVTLRAGTGETKITGLTADSRAVRLGNLFAALPGAAVDGRDFVQAAIDRGAAAVLVPDNTEISSDVPVLTSPNARAALAHMAAAFCGRQPETIAAVTGTNGKTSVAHFTRQIWNSQGFHAASIGTLGLEMPDGSVKSTLTTPDPVTLHSDLADLANQNVSHAVLEASSHGLDQHRMDGVSVQVAGFTNLSRDHLDYHQTEERYLAAKIRLFSEVLRPDGVAVLNADIPQHNALSSAFGGDKISYGWAGKEISLRDICSTHRGTRLTASFMGHNIEIELKLAGTFQAYNVMCAAGLAIGCGSRVDDVLNGLHTLQGVPGRLQLAGTVSGGSVYVDYAHTPGALENALTALRPHADGRLIVVVGCGGDRDRGKRPMMGAAAVRLADEAIITDDNPRSEDPADIRREILDDAPGAIEIGNRAEAIFHGVGLLQAGDVFVIAGKGHETGQIIGDQVLPFDDIVVAREAIEKHGGMVT
jgi:UDP-N-acetylmuramoyl-L-alanyl-D-glutamate--2,6-diaminopimelate ligase